ncbi:MAG: hypothetical protein ACI4Q3_00120 [Kiritimatiellia bacterium]
MKPFAAAWGALLLAVGDGYHWNARAYDLLAAAVREAVLGRDR